MNLNKAKRDYTEIRISRSFSSSRRSGCALIQVQEVFGIKDGPIAREKVEARLNYEFEMSPSLRGWVKFFDLHLKDLFTPYEESVSLNKEHLKFLLTEPNMSIRIRVDHQKKHILTKLHSDFLLFKKTKGLWMGDTLEGHLLNGNVRNLHSLFLIDRKRLPFNHIKETLSFKSTRSLLPPLFTED